MDEKHESSVGTQAPGTEQQQSSQESPQEEKAQASAREQESPEQTAAQSADEKKLSAVASPSPASQDTVTKDTVKKSNASLKNLSLTDKVLAPIGILVLSGWAAHWLFVGGPEAQFLLFKSWFQTLSFFGALTVATLAAMKYFGKGFLSESAERLTLSVATLCLVVGYLIEIVTSLGTFLTIGGSIALGYISLTTYWRKHIPRFATDPLGEASKSIKRAENSPSSQPDAACENAEKEKLETQLV